MAIFQVFRFRPHGAFHFGIQGIDVEATVERCPSDTLYSALYAESLLAGPTTLQPTADGTLSDPPFMLSSCLPYAGDVLLFPRPRLKAENQGESQAGQRKRDKKIQYVSLAILRHLLAGGPLATYLPDDAGAGKGRLLQGGSVLIADTDLPRIATDSVWETSRVDHVTVDRARDAGQYYAVGQVRFNQGCGLYVLAQTRDRAATEQLYVLLARLGHSGLGGQRNSGLGQFEVDDPYQIDLPDTVGRERAMLLSRYLPSLHELRGDVLGPAAAYDLTQVGGWLQSNDERVPAQRRKTITLLKEGSVVQCINGQPPRGVVANVAPDTITAHPVWRFGLALTVGVG